MIRRKIVITERQYYSESSWWRICQRKWNAKWNRICAIIVGILLFLSLMGIAFNEIINSNCSNSTDDIKLIGDNERSLLRSSRTFTECVAEKCRYYSDDVCCITCTNTDLQVVNEMAQDMPGKQGCPDNIYLTMVNVTFPNKIMYNTWLHISAPVKHLTINKCDIVDIQDDSFSAENFEYLKTLTFINMKISKLNQSIFSGLHSITDINFRLISGKFKFKADFLQAFTILDTLQVQESIYDTNTLSEFTGSDTFNLLRILILDLRNNKLSTIPANAFCSRTLESLYLGFNMLSSIENNAFRFARNIKLLELAGNNFKTLSDIPFVMTKALATLYIEKNNWECDCNLQWLKKYNILDKHKTICANGEHFDKYDFCTEADTTTTTKLSSPASTELTTPGTPNNSFGTSTSVSISPPLENTTITSTSISVTTPSIPDISTETSTTITKSSSPDSTSTTVFTSSPLLSTTAEGNQGTMKQMHCIENKVEQRLYNFRFNINMTATNEGDGTIRIRIHTANVNPTKYDFVMISSDLSKDTCYILDNISATKVNLDDDCIVCMVDKFSHSLTSPLDCVSVRSFQQAKSQPWLRDEDKIPFISICLAIVLLLIGLTAVFMFFCIRQHPQLLKGNKRVVLVKNSSADVLVMPPRKQIPFYIKSPRAELAANMEYMPRRYIPRRDPEYLTPVTSRNNACQRARPPLMRSLSDTSVKTIASYITEHQIDLNYAARRELEEVEEPPPLPPPRREYSKYDYSNEIFVYKEYS